jgi:hypothetical protein
LELAAPPAAGVVELALAGDDALPVDDRAFAWIDAGTPLDALVVTRSAALATTFARLAAAVPGGRVDVVTPETWTPEAAASHRLAVFDGVAPAAPVPALYVAPPRGNPTCPVERTGADATLVDWNGEHPLLRDLGPPQALALAHVSVLAAPAWGVPVVLAATRERGFPLLVAGETMGRRVVCLGAPFGDEQVGSDDMPLLLLALGALRWLGSAGGALALSTGVAMAAEGPVEPLSPALHVAGDPPVVIADRVGIHRLRTPAGERLVTANLFDDRESDIGPRAAGAAPATVRRPVGARGTTRRDVASWLYATALVALLLEWTVWTARASR